MRPLNVEVFARKRLLVTPKMDETDPENGPGFREFRRRFTKRIVEAAFADTAGAIVVLLSPAECLSSAWA